VYNYPNVDAVVREIDSNGNLTVRGIQITIGSLSSHRPSAQQFRLHSATWLGEKQKFELYFDWILVGGQIPSTVSVTHEPIVSKTRSIVDQVTHPGFTETFQMISSFDSRLAVFDNL